MDDLCKTTHMMDTADIIRACSGIIRTKSIVKERETGYGLTVAGYAWELSEQAVTGPLEDVGATWTLTLNDVQSNDGTVYYGAVFLKNATLNQVRGFTASFTIPANNEWSLENNTLYFNSDYDAGNTRFPLTGLTYEDVQVNSDVTVNGASLCCTDATVYGTIEKSHLDATNIVKVDGGTVTESVLNARVLIVSNGTISACSLVAGSIEVHSDGTIGRLTSISCPDKNIVVESGHFGIEVTIGDGNKRIPQYTVEFDKTSSAN